MGARRNIVDHESAIGQMTFSQGGLDSGLALVQPVQRAVEFGLIDLVETECVAHAAGFGRRGKQPRGRKLGGGFENSADEKGEDEVTASVAIRAQAAIEANLAGQ
jgi:hypothetical protein